MLRGGGWQGRNVPIRSLATLHELSTDTGTLLLERGGLALARVRVRVMG